MSVTIHQRAGLGRTWRQQVTRLTCDGGPYGVEACRESTPIDATTGAEARTYARTQGWVVAAPNPRGRRRLDYCPAHHPAEQKDQPTMNRYTVLLTNTVSSAVAVDAGDVDGALDTYHESDNMPGGITVGAFGPADVDDSDWQPYSVVDENGDTVWSEPKPGPTLTRGAVELLLAALPSNPIEGEIAGVVRQWAGKLGVDMDADAPGPRPTETTTDVDEAVITLTPAAVEILADAVEVAQWHNRPALLMIDGRSVKIKAGEHGTWSLPIAEW
ncbi:hypothetical protein [Jiangella muralis]|uniref:hypothetical protein n=1 Tax=Jiangella muralis TaxID=702383 RepID=UPI00069F04F2|nr:hypothetical protein [Jiangella muralis]